MKPKWSVNIELWREGEKSTRFLALERVRQMVWEFDSKDAAKIFLEDLEQVDPTIQGGVLMNHYEKGQEHEREG